MIIGPFIGINSDKSLKIIIALPGNNEIDELKCSFTSQGTEPNSVSSKSSNEEYRTFVFKVPKELEGKKVSYSFSYDEENIPLDLTGGLKFEDCYFHYDLNFNDSNDYFVLLSCNNPFLAKEKKGTSKDKWAMWKKLDESLDDNCKLVLLGGDQVYCDDLEEGKLSAPKAEKLKEKDRKNLKQDFINQYLKYWENISYRKVLARVPSLAMWDDHDITDGWGSRDEFRDIKGEVKDSFKIFFEEANSTFSAYQAIRNPDSISKNTKYTTSLDLGNIKFYLADFRSERNSQISELWSPAHEKDVLNDIIQTSGKESIYFLSPVIGLRTNIEDDKRLTAFSDFAKDLAQFKKKRPLLYTWGGFTPMALVFLLGAFLLFTRSGMDQFHPYDNLAQYQSGALLTISLLIILFIIKYFKQKWFIKVLVSMAFFSFLNAPYFFPFNNVAVSISSVLLIFLSLVGILLQATFGLVVVNGELSGISDDLDDALSSEPNIESFKKILKILFSKTKEGTRCAILSGDIHAAGISEFLLLEEGQTYQIPQIVSSPIGYYPMPKAVEGFSTTTSEMTYIDDKEKVKGRNLFYFSKRNFAKIYPNREFHDLEFYFEGHSNPYSLNTTFLKE